MVKPTVKTWMGSEDIKSGLRGGLAALVVGNLSAPTVVGLRDQFLARGEQIVARDFLLGQQTGFSIGVRNAMSILFASTLPIGLGAAVCCPPGVCASQCIIWRVRTLSLLRGQIWFLKKKRSRPSIESLIGCGKIGTERSAPWHRKRPRNKSQVNRRLGREVWRK